ncbi:MAG: hypothetical protein VW708_02880, partial [Ilumatobacter sp.]
MRGHITTVAALSIIVAACGEPTVESEPAVAATPETTTAPTTEAPPVEAASMTPVDGNASNADLIT